MLAPRAPVVPGTRFETTWLNGAPAVRIEIDGQLDTAVSLVIDGDRVARVSAVPNPHKLSRLDEPAPLSR